MEENITIKRLLDFKEITDDEYELLFCEKLYWNSSDEYFNKEKKFWELFSKIKSILNKKKNLIKLKLFHQVSQYNFSYICFPDMKTSPIFEEYLTIEDNKDGYKYLKSTDFSYCKFYGHVNFNDVTFEDEVKFNNAIFYKDADFSEVVFNGDTFFNNATFKKNISFENSFCEKDTFDFSNVKIGKLKLDKSLLVHASYLDISDFSKNSIKQLSNTNFQTRETARIIKSRFEEQKNMKDSYLYFIIEQNLYINDIKKNKKSSSYQKLITLLPLYLDKHISYFGTDWIKVFLRIVLFALIVFFVYDEKATIDNLIIAFDNNNLKEFFSINRMIELINPLTIFRKNDVYNNHEALGMFVRIISVYLLWQFAKSFRLGTQNR